MYAIIAGAGEVGTQVARALYEDGYNIAIIEKDEKSANEAESLDALIIRGSASSPKKLKEAGIETADLFISVTGSDEANIIGCAIAKSKGARTIARINSYEYIDEPVSDKLQGLGIDIAVCPEMVAATKISRMLSLPSLMDVDILSKGRIQVVECRVKKFSRIANKQIKDIPLPERSNIVALFRGGDVIIPFGEDRLMINDRILLIVSNPQNLVEIEDLTTPKTKGAEEQTSHGIEKVMIVGASRIGLQMAKFLERRAKVILLDDDEEVCRRASEELSNSLVIQGSGTDEDILIDEGIEDVDAFVAATLHEDTNILSCLLGKEYGATKAVAIINRPELKSMFEHIGIDVAISPRLATVGTVLQHTYTSDILSMSVLFGGKARVIEMEVGKEARIIGKPLSKIHFPKYSRIGAIVRKDEVRIPTGDDMIMLGDKLVIFCRSDMIQKVEKLFTKPSLFS
ncbi:MAG: Trk system potassium transporter TrkA [Candidatus Thermoplasmatota archaeon]|nr:Trk system potassium transporter TrkA [Candidatus Thermoplasmatota archaeon]